jgi:hypothetical protein
MKQNPARKMRQAFKNLMILLAEMRLNEKGTQRTSVNIRLSEMNTVPMCVTGTTDPFGNLTKEDTTAVIVVNNEGQLIMWSVAPVSIIQGVDLELKDGDFVKKAKEKTEYWGLRVVREETQPDTSEEVEARAEEEACKLPAMFANAWWVKLCYWRRDESCWHWSGVMVSWGTACWGGFCW